MKRSNLHREYKRALTIATEFISKIRVEQGPPGEPLCYRAFAIPIQEFFKAGYGVGTGITKEEAIISAIYEVLERICGSTLPDTFLMSTYNEMIRKGYNAVSPSQLRLYLPQQYNDLTFPYKQFSEDTNVKWVKGKSVISGEEVYIPANFVYMHPFFDSYIFEATSNGLAAGKTLKEAIINALCEAIERDAFMITWLARIPRPHIKIKNNELIKIFSEKFLISDLEFHIIDITLDIKVPTVMVISIDRKKGTGILVGCSTKPNIEDAIYKALLEGGYQGRETLKYFHKTASISSFEQIRTFEDHMKFYSNLSFEKAFDFLLSTEEIEPEYPHVSQKKAYKYVIHGIKKANLDAIIVNVTIPEVARKDISVVRAIIPGTMQLNAEYNTRTLGVKRLYSVPKTIGHKFTRINPYPHPLS